MKNMELFCFCSESYCCDSLECNRIERRFKQQNLNKQKCRIERNLREDAFLHKLKNDKLFREKLHFDMLAEYYDCENTCFGLLECIVQPFLTGGKKSVNLNRR